VIPTQKRDEAEANYRTAREATAAAKAQYDLVRSGNRAEDRAAAMAELRKAEGAVAEATSYVDDNALRSAVDGQVMVKVVSKASWSPRSASPHGRGPVRPVDHGQPARRPAGGGPNRGTLSAVIPRLGPAGTSSRVLHLPARLVRHLAATRETGGFDVRTFEVRARPFRPIDGLRPGMSAVIDWPPPDGRSKAAA